MKIMCKWFCYIEGGKESELENKTQEKMKRARLAASELQSEQMFSLPNL